VKSGFIPTIASYHIAGTARYFIIYLCVFASLSYL
jgi:hypothetical protein